MKGRYSAVLVAATLFLTSCSTFRAGVRDIGNRNMVGKEAPAINDGVWVGTESDYVGDWHIVAFLSPT